MASTFIQNAAARAIQWSRNPAVRAEQAQHPAGWSHYQSRGTPARPPARPAARAPVSFINQSPQEIEARARQITAAEVSGIRSAYQPQQQLLGQQQTGALQQHATSYAQLGQGITGLQTQQAGTAKTFENYAADAINKASTVAPGEAEARERLGLKPGEQLPESARRQQEAARTLLSGIAQGAQAGTTARQEGEANFLTNLQGSTALGNTEGAKRIEEQYALQKGKLTAQEGAAVGKATGNTANLTQKLFGEQEKDRIAAAGLNYKGQEVANKTALDRSKIGSERNKEEEGRIKLGQAREKIAQGNRKLSFEEEYKRGSLAEKKRLDSANIGDKEGKLKELGRKLKIAEEKAGPGGTKISTSQKAKWEAEMTTALNAFERGPNKAGKNGGKDYQQIRNELIGGGVVEYGGKQHGTKGQAVDPVILNAMEQVFRYHYVNAETKNALKAKGLPYEGLSNLLLRR